MTRCHTTRSRLPSLFVASQVFNTNQRSRSYVQHSSATSRRSEEAPTLRVTARSGALAGSCPPLQKTAQMQMPATVGSLQRLGIGPRVRAVAAPGHAWPSSVGSLTQTGATVCVWWWCPETAGTGAGIARICSAFGHGALTLTVRVHHIFRKQNQ